MKGANSTITGGFWEHWQTVNATSAIFHQWDQLEKSGCIDNFRILAEAKAVLRRGWYFADSDAYKWLEAACLILPTFPDTKLKQLVEDFIDLIKHAQDPDGYLYTFNQIHFPGTRWVNLQIEHELYCHGHLIEAGVSRYEASSEKDLLHIARKAADRIVADFIGKSSQFTPGHEEIEIALLRLFEVTGHAPYLELARQFLEMRGKMHGFALNILHQAIHNGQRLKQVAVREAAFDRNNQLKNEVSLPPGNTAKLPPYIQLRWIWNVLSGKFFQQHKPLRKQIAPVGHAVRFTYLQTAAAMLDRLSKQLTHLPTFDKSWEHMVRHRMYLTGGIGSLPLIEGFGRDFELDPAYAYTETCAALGCLFWNREMAKVTGQAQYSDLFEWQLYNAALVGMGLDGRSYFYNNPLESHGEVQRRAWYQVPCCPSNLSRTIAGLDQNILSVEKNEIKLQQYISSEHSVKIHQQEMIFEIDSKLPWQGKVKLFVKKAVKGSIELKLRQPSWATEMAILLNGKMLQTLSQSTRPTFDPIQSCWITLDREWEVGDCLTVDFALPIQVYFAHERVKSFRGKAALTCGPLVYCLESLDNPGMDIFNVVLNPESISSEVDVNLFGGCRTINALSTQGQNLIFIPYHLWGNRGKSEMTVFVKVKRQS